MSALMNGLYRCWLRAKAETFESKVVGFILVRPVFDEEVRITGVTEECWDDLAAGDLNH